MNCRKPTKLDDLCIMVGFDEMLVGIGMLTGAFLQQVMQNFCE
jgi:hypothetical protein